MVSTTSLTVHPNAFLTAFTSANDSDDAANDRSSVRGPLIEVAGALNGAGGGVIGRCRFCSRSLSATPTVRCRAQAARTGCWASDQAAWPMSSVSVGTGSGLQGT